MQTIRKLLPLFIFVVLLGLVILIVSRLDDVQTTSAPLLEQSPLLTPTPNPTLVATSPEATLALDYIATQENIPRAQLDVIGEEAKSFPLLNRSYTLVTLLRNQPETLRQFQVLVDINTKTVEADIAGVLRAEQAAREAKYGKFDLPLYERLQEMKEGERIAVAIWAVEAAGEDSARAAQEEVAQLYPEAAKALQEQGVAWAVNDPDLRLEIKAKYAELLGSRSTERVQPIVVWLQERGYEVEELPGAPIVSATLTKEDIQALAALPMVGQIQFGGGAAEPSSDISVPTSRIPTVWNRGFTGVGVRLGVIEGGKINSTARACLNVIATRDNAQPDSLHKSRVAAIAACNNTALPGTASGVQMLDASYPLNASMTDAAFGLQWAVVQNLADVTNHSESWDSVTAPQYLDRYYDHLVRAYDFTAIIAAGNTTGSNGVNVATPSKGWNVIGVGNIDDKNSAAWSGTGSGQDDVMNSTSSWVNPSTGIEKPELAAPGSNINTVVTPEGSGTSYAAPQVAGVAALLMQRAAALKNFPSAVKAILMASAVHNVEGTRQLSTQDGAGSIDAALADEVAQVQGGTSACNKLCWWNIAMQDSNSGQPDTYLPVGGSLYRYFTATRGERIRVVISWMSAATSDGAQDDLRTNLDLKIKRPDNSVIISSVSSVNSYEIVEFVADATGQYAIWIERFATAWPENTNKLGIAWTKQATYLPDVRGSDSSWTSSLVVRNDGAEPRPVRVTYLLENGNFAASQDYPDQLAPNATWTTSPPSWLLQGSAIVDGSEDLSVVVESERDSRTERMNYTGIRAAGGSPGWEAVGSTLYAPVVKRSYYGRSSALRITNTSSQSTDVSIDFYDASGSARTIGPYALAAGARMTRYPYEGSGSGGCNTTGTLCSARIRSQSNQPLTATVDEYRDSDGKVAIDHNLFSAGALSIYFPLVKNHWYSNNTGLGVQNVGGGNANLTLSFYDQAGGLRCTLNRNLSPYAATVVYDDSCLGGAGNPFLGSAVVTANQPLVGMANEASQDGRFKKAYSSFQGGSQAAYGPLVYNGFSESGYTWTSGVGVQNLTDQSASVTLTWYNTDGTQSGSSTLATLNSRGSQAFSPPQSGFKGSVLISADRPIAAVVNVVNSASTGDTHAVYNASNR